MSIWVALTLMAALMQSVRTAGQKSLGHGLTASGAAVVRYLYGLPFALIYLVVLIFWAGSDEASLAVIPKPELRFWGYALFAAICQLIATALMVWLFRFRNFALGSFYVKTEAMLAAVLGVLIWSETLSLLAWLSIGLGAVGIFLMGQGKASLARSDRGKALSWGQRIKHFLLDPAAGVGLLAGLLFALTSLSLRQASLSLDLDFQLGAAVTLVVMVILQTLIGALYLSWRSPSDWKAMKLQTGVCAFVGLTSVVGSVGWFTAMTLQPVAYVKAVGQIEFVFTLLVAVLFFKERPSPIELIGMGAILSGVLLLLVVG